MLRNSKQPASSVSRRPLIGVLASIAVCVLATLIVIGAGRADDAGKAAPLGEDQKASTFFGLPTDNKNDKQDKQDGNKQAPKPKPAPKPEPKLIPEPDFDIVEVLTDKQKQVLKQVTDLMAKNQTREAVAMLKQLQSNIRTTNKGRTPRHPTVEALMAQLAIVEKRPDIALKYAGPFTIDRSKYGEAYFNAYFQTAHALLGINEAAEAAKLFEWIVGKENKGVLLNQVLAAEGLALAQVAMEQPCKAVDTLKFAIHNAKARNAKDKYEGGKASMADILKRLEGRRGHMQYLCDVSRFGPDYMAFKAADEKRHKGEHLEAYKAYQALIKEFPESPYADPSELHSASCMVALGGTKQAEQKLEALIWRKPEGLYRGEAQYLLGKIAVDRHIDRDSAFEQFGKLQEWIAAIRKTPKQAAWPDVRPAAKAVIQPDRTEKKTDFWGNVERVRIKPGQLVNHLTAPWYLDDLEERAMKYIGFLHMTDGDKEQAAAAFRRVLDLDPMTRALEAKGEWNDFRRMMFGVEHGYLVAYPDELKLYSRKHRFIVMLGDFYYITERFAESEDLFVDLINGKYGPLSNAQKDYCNLARANAMCWRKGRQAALPVYEAVLERREGTLTEFRAALAVALIRIHHNEPESRKKAVTLLEELIKSKADNEFVHGARITLARIHIANGRKDQAIDLLKRMPDSTAAYKTMAEYYIREWSKIAANK